MRIGLDRLMNFFSSKGILSQFLKFGIVGLSNTAVGFGTYYLILYLGGHYLIANVVSWGLSVFNAFYWNHKYVFQGSGAWWRTLVRTYISYGASLLAGTVLLYVLVEAGGFSEWTAPWVTLVLTIPLNFVLNKYWTFR